MCELCRELGGLPRLDPVPEPELVCRERERERRPNALLMRASKAALPLWEQGLAETREGWSGMRTGRAGRRSPHAHRPPWNRRGKAGLNRTRGRPRVLGLSQCFPSVGAEAPVVYVVV